MARRTYVPLLLALSTRLCRAISRATPTLTLLYGDNEDLMTALAAANVACSVLIAELSDVREFGD